MPDIQPIKDPAIQTTTSSGLRGCVHGCRFEQLRASESVNKDKQAGEAVIRSYVSNRRGLAR